MTTSCAYCNQVTGEPNGPCYFRISNELVWHSNCFRCGYGNGGTVGCRSKLHKKNSSLKSILTSELSDSMINFSESINDDNIGEETLSTKQCKIQEKIQEMNEKSLFRYNNDFCLK